MARSDPQLNFRIPAELRDRLEAAAGENKRSLTSELVGRLEASFERVHRTQVEAAGPTREQLQRRITELERQATSNHDAMISVALVRDLLALGVRRLADRMPKEALRDENAQEAIRLSNAIIHGAAPDIEELFRHKLGLMSADEAATQAAAIADANRASSKEKWVIPPVDAAPTKPARKPKP